jgi:hypothetical protein
MKLPEIQKLEPTKRFKAIGKMWQEVKKSAPSYKAKSPSKTSRRPPGRPRMSQKKKCEAAVKRKISINMKEYKAGRFASPKQAVAVSYSQVRKKSPACRRYIRKSK